MTFTHNYTVQRSICAGNWAKPLDSKSPFIHPHTFISKNGHIGGAVKELRNQLPDSLEFEYLIDLLSQDILCGLHVKSFFHKPVLDYIPRDMVANKKPDSWYGIANLVSSLNKLFGINTVSYLSENSGNLFVHLVPKRGGDPSSRKSRKDMRGHTDGVIFPLNGLEDLDTELPPGPDFIILVALNNPGKVPTRIAPINKIMRYMKPESIRQLCLRKFIIEPQLSFDLDGVIRTHQSVLVKSEEAGYLMRYSHSKVKPMNSNNTHSVNAIKDFQKAIAASSQDIILKAGDMMYINNRTAIHGRGQVGLQEENNRRWLIRAYGQNTVNQDYCLEPDRPFQLQRK